MAWTSHRATRQNVSIGHLRDAKRNRRSCSLSQALGFAPNKRSHLRCCSFARGRGPRASDFVDIWCLLCLAIYIAFLIKFSVLLILRLISVFFFLLTGQLINLKFICVLFDLFFGDLAILKLFSFLWLLFLGDLVILKRLCVFFQQFFGALGIGHLRDAKRNRRNCPLSQALRFAPNKRS